MPGRLKSELIFRCTFMQLRRRLEKPIQALCWLQSWLKTSIQKLLENLPNQMKALKPLAWISALDLRAEVWTGLWGIMHRAMTCILIAKFPGGRDLINTPIGRVLSKLDYWLYQYWLCRDPWKIRALTNLRIIGGVVQLLLYAKLQASYEGKWCCYPECL